MYNFLNKLRAKRQAKKAEAEKKKAEANKVDKSLTEAEAHKKKHLGQKAKDLLDKAGGIEGTKSSIQNVVKYFKDDTPTDYDINLGAEGDPKPEKTIMGLPPIAIYVGGGILALVAIYAASQMMKNKGTQISTQIPIPAPVAAEPFLQQSA